MTAARPSRDGAPVVVQTSASHCAIMPPTTTPGTYVQRIAARSSVTTGALAGLGFFRGCDFGNPSERSFEGVWAYRRMKFER